MNEKTLVTWSAVTTIVGLLLLFFFAEEVPVQKVENLEDFSPQEVVRLEGVINKVTKKENVFFLEVAGIRRENQQVIIFPKEDLYLKPGNIVEITGLVEEYHGQKELIASTIVVKGEVVEGEKT